MKRNRFHTFTSTWVVASLVGAGLGCAVGWLLSALVNAWTGGGGNASLLSLLLILPLMGLGMGVGQAWALRGIVARPWWWAAATFFGWLFGVSVDLTFRRAFMLPPWGTFAMVGLYLGLLQWLILFRRLPFAAVWIVVNPLAWGLLYGLLSLFGGIMEAVSSQPLVSILVWAGVGAVIGLLTGPLLAWMIHTLPARSEAH